MKRVLIILCLILICISSINITIAYNNDNLYYDGKSKSFKYSNADKKDLFNSFKELMPGDIREQEIIISTYNINKETTMYLNTNLKVENGLKDIKFKLYKDNELLYDGQLSTINKNIKLNTFKKSDSIKLKIVIEVPTSVGNEIQNIKSNLQLEFMVEESGKEIIKPPNTYDNSNIVLNFIVMIISLVILIILFIKRQKEE